MKIRSGKEKRTMKDCLLIIDVQIGFLTKETMHIPDRIVCLAEKTKFEHIVATKFIIVQQNTSASEAEG